MGSTRIAFSLLCLLAVPAVLVAESGANWGMDRGTPHLKTAGALAFSPEGVLFIGDSQDGSVFAVDVSGDAKPDQAGDYRLDRVDEKVASLLGATTDQVLIHDMAVHPLSKRAYVSVSRGIGNDAQPVILAIGSSGEISEVVMENIRFSRVMLGKVPGKDAQDRRGRPLRQEAITDIAYADGEVFVAGLSNEEFASSLRRIPFPFGEKATVSSLEIFHVAHGDYETHAPIRTFLPIKLGGDPYILASYTCTPLVAFPVGSLMDGDHVKGKTVAELGAGNRPLDMITFRRDGQDYILLSNSNRTLMRVNAGDILGARSLTEPIAKRYGTEGIDFVSLPRVGILQLDNLDEDRVLVIERNVVDGTLGLQTYPKRRL